MAIIIVILDAIEAQEKGRDRERERERATLAVGKTRGQRSYSYGINSWPTTATAAARRKLESLVRQD